MNILGRVTVLPHLPVAIERLHELANNLYWSWTPEVRTLFRTLDPEGWERVGHNPVALLRDVSQARLDEVAADDAYLEAYKQALKHFDNYLQTRGWFHDSIDAKKGETYAYFCAEYGWHEAVALYSGGLGILAGDHTKAASDLGVPLVAVGLWYPEGYFHQRVAADGQQEAVYQRLNPHDLPFELVKDANGEELRVSVTLHGHDVFIRAWQLTIGRVPVYLLDVDIPENEPADRNLLIRLYGGDQRTRIAQEIILGIGGVRLLRALGIQPSSWHMNEGHSAFMALERCRELVMQGMSFAEAKEAVAANTLFTVHTPVAAGNDAFPFDLVTQFFGGYWGSLGLHQQAFLDLGRHDLGWGPMFSMPALALRFSAVHNGVAKLHGETSRHIWSDLWPEVPTDEVPIGHVTNGVHMDSWMAPDMIKLVSSVLPPDWRTRTDDKTMWEAVKTIDNKKLWDVRKALKAQSIRFLRRRVLKQLERHGASPTVMQGTGALFDPNALTIGFARRFATYKRATLIFKDLDRLESILSNPEKPVQLVFAGKAHPADKPGQGLIAEIHNLSKDPRFAGRILFVEDYDMAVGRALTRGTDVWLNNPRRPLEASGTSGQKAAMNGMLNLSILDGWWPEGYDGENGWAIGAGREMDNDEQADNADADALYDLLEREVVQEYYERDAQGIPNVWLERAKAAIATVCPQFNAQRMVKDYVRTYYAPLSKRMDEVAANDYAVAKELATWRKRVQAGWSSVYFSAQAMQDGVYEIGDELTVEAVLHPRDFKLDELKVEVVYSLEEHALNHHLHSVPMQCEKTYPDGGCVFRVSFKPELSGRLVYGVRVYPLNEHLISPFDAGAIRWA